MKIEDKIAQKMMQGWTLSDENCPQYILIFLD